ncbi:MAG TPA: sulfite exporter TauE/SafE family protein [Candidatus Acidoferrales bacterium]|nr:sulfite exporter TauE/SafE family protein [Candidatus Acidoferrales bacterium]
MLQHVWLIPVGFLLGAYGTIIGAGGGFLLVPLLLFAYPEEAPDTVTSISLAVVFFNALSGTLAYSRQKRIDYRSGLIFSAATVPGAILGALSTNLFSRRLFDGMFGALMILATALLVLRPTKKAKPNPLGSSQYQRRVVTEANGTEHAFFYNLPLGIGISVVVGYISTLLGVGGGFIHVPALVHLLNFPVHIATATSQFILAVMALTGTGVHLLTGTFTHGFRRTLMLGIGVLVGAQMGAYFSERLRGDWIIRGLAAALGLVGLRLVWRALAL